MGKAAGTQVLIAALLRTVGSGNGLPTVSQGAASGQRWDSGPLGEAHRAPRVPRSWLKWGEAKAKRSLAAESMGGEPCGFAFLCFAVVVCFKFI